MLLPSKFCCVVISHPKHCSGHIPAFQQLGLRLLLSLAEQAPGQDRHTPFSDRAPKARLAAKEGAGSTRSQSSSPHPPDKLCLTFPRLILSSRPEEPWAGSGSSRICGSLAPGNPLSLKHSPASRAPFPAPGVCCHFLLPSLSLSLGAGSGLMGFRIVSSKNAVQKLQCVKAAP